MGILAVLIVTFTEAVEQRVSPDTRLCRVEVHVGLFLELDATDSEVLHGLLVVPPLQFDLALGGKHFLVTEGSEAVVLEVVPASTGRESSRTISSSSFCRGFRISPQKIQDPRIPDLLHIRDLAFNHFLSFCSMTSSAGSPDLE